MRTLVSGALAGLMASALAAQTSPFVDPVIERLLLEEISGERMFETLRITTQWHKPSGSEGFFAVAREVQARAKAAGLADVRWIDQAADHPGWTARRAEAWLLEGDGPGERATRIASSEEVATSLADLSRPADVTATLIDVGAGDTAADYAGRDVRGRIVLAYGGLAEVMEQAVWKRGAAGILSWASTRLNPLADSADQVAWLAVPAEDGPAGEKTTFAFVLSARQGKALSDRLRGEPARRIMASGKRPAPPKLKVRAVVDSRFAERKTAMIEARIPGADPSLPEVVLTSHLQEEKFSANDDQSGVASMLEIGRVLSRLIAEGRLPRPRRGIRFWWCDEIYSEYRYFADHPGEEKAVLVNLNQDMVGAKQSVDSRVQYMSRTPWSRPSYLDDVQESVLRMVVDGNNAFLPAWQADTIAPGSGFTRPVFAALGTREPYDARAVPYFDNTDHLVFNDAWVGVPGTTLTNWPDEYIHSSVDDLWQVDPTQLKRNAFVVAATAWWLASAGPDAVPGLARHVAARGVERLGRDLSVAEAWVRSGVGAEAERRRAAADLMTVSLAREIAAVATAGQLAAAGDTVAVAEPVAMLRAAGESLAAALGPPESAPDPVLDRLARRTPRKAAATLAEWLLLQKRVAEKHRETARAQRDAKEGVAPARTGKRKPAPTPSDPDPAPALSGHMQWEALNWVDGKTTAAEIARRVCAEALSAGWWYYGAATPAMVETFFETQVSDGLIVW